MRNHHRIAARRYLPLGSVSEGTLRPEDIIPALLDLASEVRMSREDRREVRDCARDFAAIPANGYDDSDTGINLDSGQTPDEERYDILDCLYAILERYAPPYAYVGAHPGDGASIGVWLLESFVSDAADNGAFISDDGARGRRDEREGVPAGYSGEVLHISDHGNATLYQYSRGKAREIWSVV